MQRLKALSRSKVENWQDFDTWSISPQNQDPISVGVVVHFPPAREMTEVSALSMKHTSIPLECQNRKLKLTLLHLQQVNWCLVPIQGVFSPEPSIARMDSGSNMTLTRIQWLLKVNQGTMVTGLKKVHCILLFKGYLKELYLNSHLVVRYMRDPLQAPERSFKLASA